MKKIFSLFVALAFAVPMSAQVVSNYSGIADALSFAYGSQGNGPALQVGAGGGTSGSYTITLDYGKTTTGSSGITFYPFAGTAFPPIAIGSGSTYEVVTPSAANCGPAQANAYQQCTITATFTYAHGPGDVVRSGDYGVGEAQLYLTSTYGGGLVAISPALLKRAGVTYSHAAVDTFIKTFTSKSATATVLDYSGISTTGQGALSYQNAVGSALASTTHTIY